MPEEVVVETPKAQGLVVEPPPKEVIAPSGKRRFEMVEEPQEVTPKASEAPAESVPDAQNKGEEATPAEPEAKPEDTPEQAAKREGRRFERRLSKAYRDRAEALAKAELLEKQLAEFNKPKEPEGAPKLEDFDYDPEKYAAAKADFAKSQARKEFEAKQRDEMANQEQAKILSDWEEKAAKGEDKYDDFTEVVGDLKPTNPLLMAIMEAENGADIAYHLGKHPKEAQKLAQMPLRAQIREIGKLEAKLSAVPEKPKTPSKAPAPITPLTGTAPVVTDVPSEHDDTADWIRKRSKQVHRDRRM